MKTRTHLPRLSAQKLFKGKLSQDDPRSGRYFCMYSSVLGGIVTDPRLMTIPLEDHMVHRGDGVFEAMEIHRGKVYQMTAHMDRLGRSAEMAAIEFPMPESEIRDILLETAAVGQAREAICRVFISRGTGGFSVDPRQCDQSHLYLMITAPEGPAPSHQLRGMRVITTEIPARAEGVAQLKCCNYMPNALMEREAQLAGLDSAIALDANGYLAEGSNKNVAIVTPAGELKTPTFRHALQGTTLRRVMQLAEGLVEEGLLSGVKQTDIPRAEAYGASEIMFVATTLKTLPIIEFDGHPIGGGVPGPVVRRLREMLEQDMRENESLLTPIPYQD